MRSDELAAVTNEDGNMQTADLGPLSGPEHDTLGQDEPIMPSADGARLILSDRLIEVIEELIDRRERLVSHRPLPIIGRIIRR
jgi:hypothetical protein